jgi:polysaccharide export outer membrane protein
MGLRSHTKISRGHRVTGAVALLLVAISCTTTPAPNPDVQVNAYRVGAPDALAVTVLPDPVVQEAVTVRPDGMITIQLIGDVPAAGRTPDEIARDIEERIGRYKRGARATVAVVRAESSAVTVLGEVKAPGTYPLIKVTRAAEILGQVGGPTWLANQDEITVVRTTPGGSDMIPVDLIAIRSGDLTTNFVLAGGDIVYVPPTILGRIGYAIQAVLFPFEPLIGIARSAAGTAAVGGAR